MNLQLGISEGLREIWAHKFRSFLTMFGIVMGVGSLMATMALTAGMAKGAREVLQNMGGLERVEVRDQAPPPEQEEMAFLSPGRTYLDAMALRNAVPYIGMVSPEVEGPRMRASRGSNATNPRVIGAQAEILVTDQHVVEHGRFLTDLDERYAHRVAVLGRPVVDDLWPEAEQVPLGEFFDLGGQPFQLVGVFQRYITEAQRRREQLGMNRAQDERRVARGGNRRAGWDPFWGKNRSVIIPLSTMQVVFRSAQTDASGVDVGPDMKLTRLVVQIADLARFEASIEQMRNILTLTHRGIQDFGFETREDWFDNIERSVAASRLSGGFIASISLIVGGMGIMNIMLASITERVREIGIRRAIGARGRDIFGQILVEGLVIALVGGLLGLVAGFGFVQLLITMAPSENNPIIENVSILLSLASAIAIGLIAGLYPAMKASRLSPIQALRYE